jgi:hypothetical protein
VNELLALEILFPLTSAEGQGEGCAMCVASLSHRYLLLPNTVDQLMADEHTTKPQSPCYMVWPLADILGTMRDLAVSKIGVTTFVNHCVFDSFGKLKSEIDAAVYCIFRFIGLVFYGRSRTYRSATRPYDTSTGR